MSASYRLPRSIALAAASGLSLAAAAGCKCQDDAAGSDEAHAAPSASVQVAAEGTGKDCCMGKNECKGKGGCAVPESHSCAGKNECKGKGGCNMHCPK